MVSNYANAWVSYTLHGKKNRLSEWGTENGKPSYYISS